MASITFVCLRSWNRPLPSFHWLQFSSILSGLRGLPRVALLRPNLCLLLFMIFFCPSNLCNPTNFLVEFTMKSPKRWEFFSRYSGVILRFVHITLDSVCFICWKNNLDAKLKKTWGRHCMVDPDQLSVWKKNTRQLSVLGPPRNNQESAWLRMIGKKIDVIFVMIEVECMKVVM